MAQMKQLNQYTTTYNVREVTLIFCPFYQNSEQDRPCFRKLPVNQTPETVKKLKFLLNTVCIRSLYLTLPLVSFKSDSYKWHKKLN